LPGTFRGTVSRVNETIDQHTQLVAVYITATDQRLRNGLYMTASIESVPIPGGARLPRGALVGERRVWIVRDSVLALQDIEIAAVEDGHVIVQGLADGAEVVIDPPDEAAEGMKVPSGRPAENGSVTEGRGHGGGR